ncbi:TonB-dependent receptor domain-containing protein [Aquimarina algiphila]|uniref:TonB-dependent receptor domain-containing protein n=1 Tax=Aquimarina algiphila TaxID=2047982 RepID=UPI00232C5933|nr:TonB-dependent receptor [Aquimarina algiphila]
MNFKGFILLLLFFNFYLASAQRNTIDIKGVVLDEATDEPLEYATLVLQNLDNPGVVNGGITDASGKFNIKTSPGNYTIRVEYISYKPYVLEKQNLQSSIDLGDITLTIDTEALDEVTIIGEKTTVELRLDKKIYNIGKDLTVGGANISDVLNNVPSVAVDVDGTISLRGNENVRILINGKPSALVGFGSSDILQQLPADAIERVEVITSPSARYDAEGTAGILNIILRKEKTLGLNGSINTNIGYPTASQITTNFNLRSDKFNIFNTLGYFYREPPGSAFFDNSYTNGTYTRIIEERDVSRENLGFNVNLGMEYYLTKKSSLTGSIFARFSDEHETTENNSQRFAQNDINDITLRNEDQSEDDKSYQASLNYTNNFNDEGHQLTADFQYGYNKEEVITTIDENIIIPDNQLLSEEAVFETETQNEFLLQTDYVLPIGDKQFEAGYRGDFEKEVTVYQLDTLNLNTGEFEINQDLTNQFNYTENINALYSQYGDKTGKLSFLFGLRLENTRLKGEVISEYDADALQELLGEDVDLNFDKNYLGLFLTVNLIYELAEDENISLGYNRRINRPRGFFINPFPSRSSVINIFQGNPDLDPAYANAFDLGYLKRWEKLTLTSSIYYQRETNSFEVIQEETGQTTADGIFIIRSIPVNLSTNKRYGAELGILYNPSRKIRFNWSFNLFKFVSDGIFNNVDYGTENTSWFSRFSSNIRLPGEIQWQTNANYRGPRKNSQTKYDGIFFLDLAFSKDILSEKASVTLNVRDLLNSRKRLLSTETDFFTSEGELQRRERQITLSFIYRINQKKERNGRQKQNNEEEEGF